MADNYIERQQEQYEARKAAWKQAQKYGKKKTGTAAKQILSYNGLDDKTETDRIYTAKVKVYKSGAAEKGFPEDELVASLDGAKEN